MFTPCCITSFFFFTCMCIMNTCYYFCYIDCFAYLYNLMYNKKGSKCDRRGEVDVWFHHVLILFTSLLRCVHHFTWNVMMVCCCCCCAHTHAPGTDLLKHTHTHIHARTRMAVIVGGRHGAGSPDLRLSISYWPPYRGLCRAITERLFYIFLIMYNNKIVRVCLKSDKDLLE